MSAPAGQRAILLIEGAEQCVLVCCISSGSPRNADAGRVLRQSPQLASEVSGARTSS
jgi:hypothetical protein